MLAALVLAVVAGRFLGKALNASGVPRKPVIVAVEGEVREPGSYLLEGPVVSVGQVVKVAGGLSGERTASIPPEIAARSVRNGQAVRLSASDQGAAAVHIEAMTATARLTLGEKLNVNTASEEELMLVPQMKTGFAAAIANQRRQNCWGRLEELERIPGVGPKTIEKWQPYLEVGVCDGRKE